MPASVKTFNIKQHEITMVKHIAKCKYIHMYLADISNIPMIDKGSLKNVLI